jgi:uncharacterized repeat protein (TIGR01451 family)
LTPTFYSSILSICIALLAWLWADVAPVAAQGPPDLSVEGNGGLVVPGGEVTYQIRLLNWSDALLPSAVISQTLPAGFSYIPGSTLVTVGGWPITQADPIQADGTLVWGPFQLPAAGHTAHNPYGVHTFVQDLCLPDFIDFQLNQALALAGSGGYVTQLFYRITSDTAGPDPCAVYFVNAAYDRNLVPILRLQGVWNPVGFWEKPSPGPQGDYADVAAAFASYVAGLPRRNTHPLYVTIWNEPDLWIEWGGHPNAQEYGRFFVAVSNAIRRLGDPRIRILNGAVTPTNKTFIRRLMGVPGFAAAFDAWASHCYPYNHPPSYNIHRRTARYGNAVIDCYIEERDTITRYGGRTGYKFVIKETGYGLGEDLYAFEGYRRINESNRASYISSAFKDYWRTWPEVIAVTPFELGDPWSGWDWLDWVDYKVSLDPFAFSYTPHQQFHTVTALPKPHGAPVPHGFEVAFRARVAGSLSPGTYASQLSGAALGATTVLTPAAPVRVVAHLEQMYLPLLGANQTGGVWYLQAPPDGATAILPVDGADQSPVERLQAGEQDGAIVPTHFLSEDSAALRTQDQAAWSVKRALDAAEPCLLALDGRSGRAYLGLSGGELAVLNLSTLKVEELISLGADPQALAPASQTGMLYAALSSGEVVRVDAVRGKVTARTHGLYNARGIVFDPQTETVLIAVAGQGKIIRFKGDLSARVAVYALEDLPGQVGLDADGRRLYVLLPGARRVLALDADTLRPVAQAELVGGPLVEMALDVEHDRVYVLSALSPEYRAISVLRAEDLSRLALVAGSPAVPLERAAALALSPGGQLLVAEGARLYQVSPEDFRLVSQASMTYPARLGGLEADPVTGRIVWAGPRGVWVVDTPVTGFP